MTPPLASNIAIGNILSLAPVMPVVSLPSLDLAVPLARCLVEAGARTIEITLRNDCALEAIERVATAVPEILVGAGTVLNSADFNRVRAAGAAFAISPGCTADLAEAARRDEFPYLPAVSTVSEMMCLRDLGFQFLKLFPAKVVGGPAFLKAVGAPLPDIRFCPTGGVRADTAADYLALDNVACVGGSWIAPTKAIQARDWQGISERVRACAALSAG